MNQFILFLIRKRLIFLILLFVLTLLSLLNVTLSKSSFLTGIGDIKGSDSNYVKSQINSKFNSQIPSNLIVVSDKKNSSIETFLNTQSEIENVYNNQNNYFLSSMINNEKSIFIIKLKKGTFKDYEDYTPLIRERIKASFPNQEEIFVTGNSAFSYDMNYLSEKQGKEAEISVLIITLIVLIFAFGSISGAFIAVSSGFITTIITISILKVISSYYNLSIFCQNISTMLGLGLSIDYSLLIISRFRKEKENDTPLQALIKTINVSGKSVMYSGLTVMIGFTALFIPQLNISDSIALGGSIVSLFAVIISLTYVPLMLYFSHKIIDYPFKKKEKVWFSERFANFINSNSLTLVLVSLFILVIMALPVLDINLAEPDIKTMPDNMESKQGFLALETSSNSDLFFPLQIIIESEKSINTDNIELYSFLHQLKNYPFAKIFTVFGELNSTDYINNLFMRNSGIANDLFSVADNYLLSKDKKQTLVMVFPKKELKSYQINKIISEIKTIENKSFKLYIGGEAALGYDLVKDLYKNFYLMVLFIYILTFIVLYTSYRSILIPLKAILVNSFSVIACYGIMIIIFQYGYGSYLINLKYVPEAIISGIPVILFCIMFSLSMDYEVFLLSGIYEEYLKTGDNNQAVFKGIVKTSGVITKAALVMLIVFAAFIRADIILIKMLGVGLAFAVLIDATLIRLILVPSLMNLAGKYNWMNFSDFINKSQKK